MKRRNLIRALIALAVGIPILVEARTVVGLFGGALFEDGSGTPRRTTTGSIERVGVGDELLPETPQTETVTEAIVNAGEDAWTFVLSVKVSNDGEAAYELRLGPVTTTDGETVRGTASTDRVRPGDTAEVTGEWDLPTAATPATVIAVARSQEGATPTAVTEEVRLGDVPVRNR